MHDVVKKIGRRGLIELGKKRAKKETEMAKKKATKKKVSKKTLKKPSKKKTKKKTPSKAYFIFEKTIGRSLDLIVLQKPTEAIIQASKPAGNVDSSDLLRAALVLGVAAMDSYFTDVFAERFVPFIRKKGHNENMVALLEQAGLNVETTLEIMRLIRPYRRIRTLIETHLDNHVTQRADVIDRLFLAYNLKNFTQHIGKLKRRSTLVASIKNAVKRRHKIVHRGDINSHNKLNPITKRDVEHKLKDIILFVSGADEILKNQL
jgi:RiboL-PSP-HEPN